VETDYEDIVVYDLEGDPLGDAELEALESLGEQVLARAQRIAEQGDEDVSLYDAIQSSLRVESRALDGLDQIRLSYVWNSQIEHEFAGSIQDLSAWAFDDAEAFGGGDAILPGGYGQIVDDLAEGLDIRLEHAVDRAEHGAEGVRVWAEGGRVELRAERLISTLPAPLIEAIDFDPPLPFEKVEAGFSTGRGLLNKTVLRFAPEDWPKGEPVFIGRIDEGQRFSEFLNLEPLTGAPLVIGFNAAAFAEALETYSDEETVAEAMEALRGFYGDDLPEPIDWQITRWGQDRFAQGSYSFNAVGGGAETRRILAEPVGDRLFFAGEATSEDYPSTVHGAYLSGLREAERILAG
jgi:hypothetical protein